MPEPLTTPETQEMLSRAVNKVVGLWYGDVLQLALRTQPPDVRDQSWNEAASQFPPLSDRMRELREALKNAYETQTAYPESVTVAMEMHFADVKERAARMLLTHLLFARTSVAPGYMDYSMDVVVEEANAMIRELGISEDKELASLQIEDVVKAVLSGKLKVTRQTQLEKK